MSILRAHIFEQRVVGQREEVKIKLFDENGDLIDLNNLGGDAPAPVSPWVVAGPSSMQGPLIAGAQNLGPELEFEVGVHGLVLAHASMMAWHPPSQMQVDLKLDSGTPGEMVLGSIAMAQSAPTMLGLSAQGLAVSNNQDLSPVGAILFIGTGTHKLQFSTPGINPGGYYQQAKLAVMAIG